MAGNGRPTSLTPAKHKQVMELIALGMSEEEVAECIGVHSKTIYNWKKSNEKFLLDIKKEKYLRDQQVEDSLFMRAKGFTKRVQKHADGAIFEIEQYYPPDPASAIFWKKARNRWRDRWEEESHPQPITIQFNMPRPKHKIAARGGKVVEGEVVPAARRKPKGKEGAD